MLNTCSNVLTFKDMAIDQNVLDFLSHVTKHRHISLKLQSLIIIVIYVVKNKRDEYILVSFIRHLLFGQGYLYDSKIRIHRWIN